MRARSVATGTGPFARHAAVRAGGRTFSQEELEAACVAGGASTTDALVLTGLAAAGVGRIVALGRTKKRVSALTRWLDERAAALAPERFVVLDDVDDPAVLAALYGAEPDVVVDSPEPASAADLLKRAGATADDLLWRFALENAPRPELVVAPPTLAPAVLRGRIIVSGVGGVGCNILIGLVAAALITESRCDLAVHLFDDDVVSESNLNRQLLFDDSTLGESKVRAALAALPDVGIRFSATEGRFTPADADAFEPSVLVSAVDTYEGRLAQNDHAMSRRIPLVEAGCSPFCARTDAVLPGKTNCLRERLDLARRAEDEQRNRRSVSCGEREDAAIVGSNMVAAGLAIECLFTVLTGNEAPRTLLYDLRQPGTFGARAAGPPCGH